VVRGPRELTPTAPTLLLDVSQSLLQTTKIVKKFTPVLVSMETMDGEQTPVLLTIKFI
jgi:hypothetical protein